MESKTVKGIVELVNPQYNSVKLKDMPETYSGKFSYKGLLPNIGDEVVLTVASQVSKKDGKTYWNITDIVVAKACEKPVVQQTDKEKSIIAQCLTKIVFGEKGAKPEEVFDCYMNFVSKL